MTQLTPASAGWVGSWSGALEASVAWSRQHGHRHRIRWDVARGSWRITCLLPAQATAS